MLSPRSSMVTPDALSRSMSRISFCAKQSDQEAVGAEEGWSERSVPGRCRCCRPGPAAPKGLVGPFPSLQQSFSPCSFSCHGLALPPQPAEEAHLRCCRAPLHTCTRPRSIGIAPVPDHPVRKVPRAGGLPATADRRAEHQRLAVWGGVEAQFSTLRA